MYHFPIRRKSSVSRAQDRSAAPVQRISYTQHRGVGRILCSSDNNHWQILGVHESAAMNTAFLVSGVELIKLKISLSSARDYFWQTHWGVSLSDESGGMMAVIIVSALFSRTLHWIIYNSIFLVRVVRPHSRRRDMSFLLRIRTSALWLIHYRWFLR